MNNFIKDFDSLDNLECETERESGQKDEHNNVKKHFEALLSEIEIQYYINILEKHIFNNPNNSKYITILEAIQKATNNDDKKEIIFFAYILSSSFTDMAQIHEKDRLIQLISIGK